MAADQPGRTLPEATWRLARLVVAALLVALALPGSSLGATITVTTVSDVHSGTTVELRDLTVTGGQTPTPADASPGTDHSGDPNTPGTGPNGANAAAGGGILSLGALTLRRVTVTGNATGDGGGGGDGG